MDDLTRLAEMLAKSGYFDDARSAAQCGVKVLAGLELGFPAFVSMAGIYIVKGKPEIGANLMAAAVKRSDKYDFKVREMNDETCSIVFLEAGQEIGTSTFSKQDAIRAGTQNMGKFPRNMLYARAMSNDVRWFTPDVFLAPVYTPEELGAKVDEEGEVIEVSATRAAPEKPLEVQKVQPEPTKAEESEPISTKQPANDAARGEVINWAFNQTTNKGQPIFEALKQTANSYDKLKREYIASLEPRLRPTIESTEEEKAAHHLAVNKLWLKKIDAYRDGEDYSLPPYPEEGKELIAVPFASDEGIGARELANA